jgi:VanZ family protein
MTPPPRWLILTGFWIPFAIASYAAFAPEGVPTPFQKISDIVLHAFTFTYLTATLWLAHFSGGRAWKSAAWMLAYGIFIELVQTQEPMRSAEFKDVGVDMIGILLGIGLYRGVLVRLAAPMAFGDVPKHQS